MGRIMIISKLSFKQKRGFRQKNKKCLKKSHMTEKSHNPRGIMWDSEIQIPHLAQNGGKSHPQCGNFDFPKIPHFQIPHVG